MRRSLIASAVAATLMCAVTGRTQTRQLVLSGRTIDSVGVAVSATIVVRTANARRDSLAGITSGADGAFRLVLPATLPSLSLEARVGTGPITRLDLDSAGIAGAEARPMVLRLGRATQLASVQVRARFQRRPSVFGFFEGEPASRIDRAGPGTTDWLDAMRVGTADAILAATPELLVQGDGFSALGVPSSSNQVQIGGVRVPMDLVSGPLNGTVTVSPWDATIGGSAGAVINLLLAAASPIQTAYGAVRLGASGIPSALERPTSGSSLAFPVQVNAGLTGPLGRLGYRLNVFGTERTAHLTAWDQSLTSADRLALDSIARVLHAPTLATEDRVRRAGLTGRLDFRPSDTKRVLALTSGASQTNAALNGVADFVSGAAAQFAKEQVGFLQLESTQVLGARVLSSSIFTMTRSVSQTEAATNAPSLFVTDPSLGQIAQLGGAAPVPTLTVSSLEARSTATWYSRDNATRFVVQLQARGGSARTSVVEAHNVFLAASLADVAVGRAVGLTRTDARSGMTVTTLVVAPSINLRQDLGSQGILSMGARADGWTVGSLTTEAHLRAVDISPRASFLRRLYTSRTAGQPAATLRFGLGRFTDWPNVTQWSDASASSTLVQTTCAGQSVPVVNLTNPNAACAADAMSARTMLAADRLLRPVQSDRADLSLAIARLPFGTRADFGVSAARTTRIAVRESPFARLAVASVLTGDGGRQIYAPTTLIGLDGSVPVRSVPSGADGLTVLRSEGSSRATQFRVRLLSRNPFARVRLETSYAFTMGNERVWNLSDVRGAPHGSTAPLTAAGRHTVAFSAGVWVRDVELRFSGMLRSGSRFTPIADRDLNGDGRANDPVFVTATDAVRFTAAVPSYLRSCIEANVARVAALNSCTGSWSLTSLAFATIPGVHLGLPLGSSVDLLLSNLLGVFARAGGSRAVIFGPPATGSMVLAHVTSFSSRDQQFQTEPLSGFGALTGLSGQLSEPIRLSLGIRAPLGRSVIAQRAVLALATIRTDSSARARARAATQLFSDLPPLPMLVLQGGEDVQLTAAQRQALMGLMSRWQASMSRLFAEATEANPRDARTSVTRLSDARARFFEEAIQIAAEIARALTADQLERLPDGIQRLLSARFLRFLATQDAATG